MLVNGLCRYVVVHGIKVIGSFLWMAHPEVVAA